MAKRPDRSWFNRLGMIFVSLALLTPALGAVLGHRTFYQNIWGAPVFVPIALFGGLCVLCLVIVRWNRFDKKRDGRRH